MARSSLIVGVRGHAVAIDPATGTELWRTRLKSSSYATVWVAGDRVFAGAGGELFCLDRSSGSVLWRNHLKGLGLGIIAFSGGGDFVAAAADSERARAAGAAAAS